MRTRIKQLFIAPPSIKINVLVICEILALLIVSLGLLFFFSRNTLIEEAKLDAENRLDGTMYHVDNVLLSVEQTTGNIYYELLEHLDQPDRMMTYSKHVVASNPNIMGCAIAFEPGYYPDRELYMAFYYRKKHGSRELHESATFGRKPYNVQSWYAGIIHSDKPTWLNPHENFEFYTEPFISFCLPITDKQGEHVGVMAVDLSVERLSQIVLKSEASRHGYGLLLDGNGTFLIHPDRDNRLRHTAFTLADELGNPSIRKAAEEILSGNVGATEFELNDQDWMAFYKPFKRTAAPGRSYESLNWTLSIIYPTSEIFHEYNHHLKNVVVISTIALLLFYILCRIVIRSQLKPLRMLHDTAQSIAEGNYSMIIPDTRREDEIGVFQRNFKRMQDALIEEVTQQQKLSDDLQERHETLKQKLSKIQEDDNVKTTFLHNVTNRMIKPASSILDSVNNLCDNYKQISVEEADREIDNINEKGAVIMELLSHKFNASTKEAGKEVSHG